MQKVWLISSEGYGSNGARHYGMSTAAGAQLSDLPTEDVPQGSDCFDYSTQSVYFYDGVEWK